MAFEKTKKPTKTKNKKKTGFENLTLVSRNFLLDLMTSQHWTLKIMRHWRHQQHPAPPRTLTMTGELVSCATYLEDLVMGATKWLFLTVSDGLSTDSQLPSLLLLVEFLQCWHWTRALSLRAAHICCSMGCKKVQSPSEHSSLMSSGYIWMSLSAMFSSSLCLPSQAKAPPRVGEKPAEISPPAMLL